MQNSKTFKTIWLCAALLLASLVTSTATTYLSNASAGNPTLLTAWTNSAGANPADFTSGDTFIIQSGHNYSIPASTDWTVNATTAGTAATVQVNSGGTLTFTLPSGSNCRLLLGGNLIRNGTLAGTATSGNGYILFTSSGAWTGSGDISGVKLNVTVNVGATLNASGLSTGFVLRSGNTTQINVDGTLNLGTLQVSGGSASGSAQFHLNSGGTLITANTSASGVPGIFTSFNTGKITLDPGANYTFNGTAAQVTGTTANNATMPSTVNNLTVNNSAGVALSQATEVDGTLGFTAGKVTGNVALGGSATISGVSSTTYVNGQLTVPFTAPSSVSYTFPVGTASAYSPVSIANFTDAGSGTLTASATAAQNLNQSSSGISSTKYIKRYWTLTDNGGFASPSYDFTGVFVTGDIQGGANTASLIVRKWDGSSWSSPAGSSSTSTTITGTGFATSFGQFAAGEVETLPVLNSLTASAVTATTATLGATVTTDSGSAITDYGIVWSTAPDPTIANNKVQAGTSVTPPNTFTVGATALPPGLLVYFRGYATSANGTGYSTNGSILTITNEPTIQASAVSAIARQNGNLFVSWTRGNGARCIVLVNATGPVDSNPVDGSTYTANAAFGSGAQIGSGNYVAYLGTGTNVTLTALSAATTYYVAVYELNGAGGSENYLAPPATGSQTTVASPISSLTWNGNADTDWNNTNNWDALLVPDVGTAAIIPGSPANQPIYTNPMVAASFGALTSGSVLTVATNGFVIDGSGNTAALFFGSTSARLSIATNGVMSIPNGGMTLQTNGNATVDAGGTLSMKGTLIVGAGGNSSSGGGQGFFTNNSGIVSLGGITVNNSGNNQTCIALINGGINDLGAVTVGRSAASSAPALGTEGLIINNGVVRTTSIDVGGGSGNSWLTMYFKDGLLTNTGAFTVRFQNTASRFSRFYQAGGILVSTNTSVHLRGQTSANNGFVIYTVNGGTNLVGGFVIADAGDVHHSVFLTNNAKLYIGSGGIAMGGGSLDATNVVLAANGTFGALADWTNSVPMQIDGGIFNASDLDGNAHNIMIASPLRGSGDLTKTGNGTLTLNAANTYSGNTFIGTGTLALGVSGFLNNSAKIVVGNGAVFDVSQVSGYNLPAAKSLTGFGTVAGNVTFASTAILNPGSNTLTGTLTFSNSITQTGGAVNHFDLSSNPSGPDNDLIVVQGDINVSGTSNILEVVGGGTAGSIHPLFKYTGNFNGTLANFALVGASGVLTNDTSTTPKTIGLVVVSTIRSATNIVWVGNSTTNVWDILNATNWLIGSSLDFFVTGDAVTFNNTGLSHPNVDIAASVQPSSVVVNATGDYVFGGAGAIGGLGGITKTNTGTLVVANTNNYTGVTAIQGGALAVSSLANGSIASPIGAASSASANIVIDGGTLEYRGDNASTDRGMTLGTTGAAISVTNAANTLTVSGTLAGTGSLIKTGPGILALSSANSYSGGTVVSNGVLQINIATGAGSASITNRGGAFRVNGALVVDNAMQFDGNSTIQLSSVGSGNVALRGAWSGDGYVTANFLTQNSSQVLSIGGEGAGGGNMANFSGTVDFGANQGFVRLNNNSTYNYGSSNATFNLGTGTVSFSQRNGPTTTYLGALIGGPNTRLTGSRSDTHGQEIYEIGGKNISTTFEGVITNGNQANDTTAIVKVGTGRLTLAGANTYTGPTTVESGTLQVNGSLASGSAVTVNNGLLAGTGTVGGATTVNSGATLEAGVDGIGTLTFSGNLTLNTGSTNSFVVTTSGGVSNSVAVNGLLSPNDSVIKVASGTALGVGTYTLFTYGSANGSQFNATPVFDVAPADTASIVDTGSQINLVIGTPSGPSFSSITTSGNDITLNATGGTPGGSVTVLTSTDLTLPLASWTVVTTGNFDGSGNYSYTVTDALISGQPQQFYILQTP